MRDPVTKRLSSTRLGALICVLAGVLIALGAVRFAFLHPQHAEMVTAIAGIIQTLLTLGGGAYLMRTRSTAAPKDPE